MGYGFQLDSEEPGEPWSLSQCWLQGEWRITWGQRKNWLNVYINLRRTAVCTLMACYMTATVNGTKPQNRRPAYHTFWLRPSVWYPNLRLSAVWWYSAARWTKLLRCRSRCLLPWYRIANMFMIPIVTATCISELDCLPTENFFHHRGGSSLITISRSILSAVVCWLLISLLQETIINGYGLR